MLPDFKKYWHGDSPEPLFLLEQHDPEGPKRRLASIVGALLYDLALVIAALGLPSGVSEFGSAPNILVDVRKSVPLVAPRLPPELTQTSPNKSKPSTEVDLASLVPRPAAQPAALKTPAALSASPNPAAPSLIDAPKVETARLDPSQMPAPAGPQIQAQEPPKAVPPKIAFESVGGPAAPTGPPKIQVPRGTVEEAIRGAMRNGGGGLSVGDFDDTPGGIGEVLGQKPSPGRTGAVMELLSDPQGVDFRPYLTQVLATVRRNWKSVIPESARFGQRGRVSLQFSINRAGAVPKLVIAMPSGVESLDRAAVTGVSMSVPLPPLPAAYRGDTIRLQLNFSYNMPSR